MINEVNKILEDANIHTSLWGRRIIAAAQKGRFTLDDISRANRWTGCACGQQHSRLMKTAASGPLDLQMYTSGVQFGYSVENHDMLRAADRLVNVHYRAIVLLAAPELTQRHTDGFAL